jgi:hypothetical protein
MMGTVVVVVESPAAVRAEVEVVSSGAAATPSALEPPEVARPIANPTRSTTIATAEAIAMFLAFISMRRG